MTTSKAFGLAAICAFLDLAVKFFVKRNNFTIVENPGLPFGVQLPGFFSAAIVAAAFILFLYLYQKYFHATKSFGWSLVVGGAIGNLLDRLWDGRVIDFILIGAGTFNLADFFIWSGIVLLLLKRNSKATI